MKVRDWFVDVICDYASFYLVDDSVFIQFLDFMLISNAGSICCNICFPLCNMYLTYNFSCILRIVQEHIRRNF